MMVAESSELDCKFNANINMYEVAIVMAWYNLKSRTISKNGAERQGSEDSEHYHIYIMLVHLTATLNNQVVLVCTATWWRNNKKANFHKKPH